jgi:hypothetical protein
MLSNSLFSGARLYSSSFLWLRPTLARCPRNLPQRQRQPFRLDQRRGPDANRLHGEGRRHQINHHAIRSRYSANPEGPPGRRRRLHALRAPRLDLDLPIQPWNWSPSWLHGSSSPLLCSTRLQGRLRQDGSPGTSIKYFLILCLFQIHFQT